MISMNNMRKTLKPQCEIRKTRKSLKRTCRRKRRGGENRYRVSCTIRCNMINTCKIEAIEIKDQCRNLIFYFNGVQVGERIYYIRKKFNSNSLYISNKDKQTKNLDDCFKDNTKKTDVKKIILEIIKHPKKFGWSEETCRFNYTIHIKGEDIAETGTIDKRKR